MNQMFCGYISIANGGPFSITLCSVPQPCWSLLVKLNLAQYDLKKQCAISERLIDGYMNCPGLVSSLLQTYVEYIP
jgi:hypothetical protein